MIVKPVRLKAFFYLYLLIRTVVQCTRCTSAVTATNRATNGHRFVFYSNQITNTQRYYVPNEPGVNLFVNATPPHQQGPYHHQNVSPGYIPPPPPSSPPPLVSAYSTLDMDHRSYGMPYGMHRSANRWPGGNGHRGSSFHPSTVNIHTTSSLAIEHNEPAGRLRAGEVLYWHQLSRNGEIPSIEDNPRARAGATPGFDR
jgi:hypothetical protein